MTDFVLNTVNDMRGGRQSWRVIITMSVPSLLIAVILAASHV